MLTLGVMLTACSADWWEEKKYGKDLTLDDITVKGTELSVLLPSGKTQKLWLERAYSERDSVVMPDTIHTTLPAVQTEDLPCGEYILDSYKLKDQKGNLRISEALGQTKVTFGGYHIPIYFRHEIVSVVDRQGKESVRIPQMKFDAAATLLSAEQTSVGYVSARYKMSVNVFDAGGFVGTVTTVIKVTALN